MPILHLMVSCELLALISKKYRLVDEDGVDLHGAGVTIKSLPLGKM